MISNFQILRPHGLSLPLSLSFSLSLSVSVSLSLSVSLSVPSCSRSSFLTRHSGSSIFSDSFPVQVSQLTNLLLQLIVATRFPDSRVVFWSYPGGFLLGFLTLSLSLLGGLESNPYVGAQLASSTEGSGKPNADNAFHEQSWQWHETWLWGGVSGQVWLQQAAARACDSVSLSCLVTYIYIYLLYNVLRVSLVRLKNSRFALRVESQR